MGAQQSSGRYEKKLNKLRRRKRLHNSTIINFPANHIYEDVGASASGRADVRITEKQKNIRPQSLDDTLLDRPDYGNAMYQLRLLQANRTTTQIGDSQQHLETKSEATDSDGFKDVYEDDVDPSDVDDFKDVLPYSSLDFNDSRTSKKNHQRRNSLPIDSLAVNTPPAEVARDDITTETISTQPEIPKTSEVPISPIQKEPQSPPIDMLTCEDILSLLEDIKTIIRDGQESDDDIHARLLKCKHKAEIVPVTSIKIHTKKRNLIGKINKFIYWYQRIDGTGFNQDCIDGTSTNPDSINGILKSNENAKTPAVSSSTENICIDVPTTPTIQRNLEGLVELINPTDFQTVINVLQEVRVELENLNWKMSEFPGIRSNPEYEQLIQETKYCESVLNKIREIEGVNQDIMSEYSNFILQLLEYFDNIVKNNEQNLHDLNILGNDDSESIHCQTEENSIDDKNNYTIKSQSEPHASLQENAYLDTINDREVSTDFRSLENLDDDENDLYKVITVCDAVNMAYVNIEEKNNVGPLSLEDDDYLYETNVHGQVVFKHEISEKPFVVDPISFSKCRMRPLSIIHEQQDDYHYSDDDVVPKIQIPIEYEEDYSEEWHTSSEEGVNEVEEFKKLERQCEENLEVNEIYNNSFYKENEQKESLSYNAFNQSYSIKNNLNEEDSVPDYAPPQIPVDYQQNGNSSEPTSQDTIQPKIMSNSISGVLDLQNYEFNANEMKSYLAIIKINNNIDNINEQIDSFADNKGVVDNSNLCKYIVDNMRILNSIDNCDYNRDLLDIIDHTSDRIQECLRMLNKIRP